MLEQLDQLIETLVKSSGYVVTPEERAKFRVRDEEEAKALNAPAEHYKRKPAPPTTSTHRVHTEKGIKEFTSLAGAQAFLATVPNGAIEDLKTQQIDPKHRKGSFIRKSALVASADFLDKVLNILVEELNETVTTSSYKRYSIIRGLEKKGKLTPDIEDRLLKLELSSIKRENNKKDNKQKQA